VADARADRLVLGTVALGMAYGIAGRDAPAESAALAVIRAAAALGVGAIDTAPAYGEAERRVGLALGATARPNAASGSRSAPPAGCGPSSIRWC
jgi:aryl-alcohol dehydrogenase-like predicted oxidoreductase